MFYKYIYNLNLLNMKSNSLRTVAISIIATFVLFATISWGPFGHEHINKAAVLALPEPVRTFFYNHIDFVTQESTVPDLRKYTLRDNTEKPRHYIDLEMVLPIQFPKLRN